MPVKKRRHIPLFCTSMNDIDDKLKTLLTHSPISSIFFEMVFISSLDSACKVSNS